VILAAAALLAACSGRPKEDVVLEIAPATAGALTVATTLPAPGFWEGDDATIVGGGYEWGIAKALADEFNLDLVVLDLPFAEIVGGDLGGADLALAQIEITEERREVLDFSVPYYTTSFGVLMPAGEHLRDVEAARELTWIAVEGSRQQDFLAATIRPREPVALVENDVDAAEAVLADDVDAALIDLSSALILSHDDERLAAVAQFEQGGQYAPALPKGSPNLQVIDAAMTGLLRDEFVHSLAESWLLPLYSVPPEDVPVIPLA
jgi:polar amino acid transport system substrate-binding protein